MLTEEYDRTDHHPVVKAARCQNEHRVGLRWVSLAYTLYFRNSLCRSYRDIFQSLVRTLRFDKRCYCNERSSENLAYIQYPRRLESHNRRRQADVGRGDTLQ